MNRLTVAAGLSVGLLAATVPAVPAAESQIPATQLINEQITAGWKAADIKKTAGRATDPEFLRRAFIDLIGRVATPEEVLDFEQDRSPNKRARLVNRLLNDSGYQPKVNGRPVMGDDKKPVTFDYADEYARHWSNLWTVWLMSRTVHQGYRDQMHFWLYNEVFLPNRSYKEMVTRLLTATGKSNDNGAVNFIAHQLGEQNPAERRDEFGRFDVVPATSRITRLFLGLQTQCAQCHDHPFNKEWVQNDFWGVNAYLRQVTRDGTPTPRPDLQRNNQMANALAVLTLGDDPGVNTNGIVFWERRDGKLMASKPAFLKDFGKVMKELDGGKLELSTKTPSTVPGAKTRREALAHYVTSHDMFAKAYVNRVWGHLFGRGLNKEPSTDDFGSENEVVHPELLEKLTAEFARYNYDPKLLLEWVCNSDAYQLSHVGVKEYTDPKYDPYFARMPLKALSPEVLFESLMTATQAEDSATSDRRKRLREQWMSKLVRNFGDDEGNEVTFNGTIVQALLMMNGRELNDEISARGTNAVTKVIQKHGKGRAPSPDLVIDDLFLLTLNRHATTEEKAKIKSLQSQGATLKTDGGKPAAPQPKPPVVKGPKGKGPNRPGPQPAAPPGYVPPSGADPSFYEDVFWALLNTNEFMLNH